MLLLRSESPLLGREIMIDRDLVIIITISIALSSMAILLMIVFLGSRKNRRIVQAQAAQIHSLEGNVNAVCAGFAGLSSTIARVEQQLRRLAERQEQLEMRDPSTHSHEHAIKLARSGASIEELVEICGLVRDEADLLICLHGCDSKKVVNFE